MATLNVYALPSLVTAEELHRGHAVVIDVLRASTTIVHALEAGAVEIWPCEEIEEAFERRAQLGGDALLGGERGGVRIEGFDLANSPAEYIPESVGGRRLVFTTTNGTRALSRARNAARVLVGAFVNATALFRQLVGEHEIHLICAGTEGEYSRDDVLFAGMMVDWLARRGGGTYQLNAQAATARENWTSAFAPPYASGAELLPAELLASELEKSLGGQNLVRLGLQEDILAAATIDRFDAVPVLDKDRFALYLP